MRLFERSGADSRREKTRPGAMPDYIDTSAPRPVDVWMKGKARPMLEKEAANMLHPNYRPRGSEDMPSTVRNITRRPRFPQAVLQEAVRQSGLRSYTAKEQADGTGRYSLAELNIDPNDHEALEEHSAQIIQRIKRLMVAAIKNGGQREVQLPIKAPRNANPDKKPDSPAEPESPEGEPLLNERSDPDARTVVLAYVIAVLNELEGVRAFQTISREQNENYDVIVVQW